MAKKTAKVAPPAVPAIRPTPAMDKAKVSVLTQELAAATISGVRSPIAGYPSDGLTPDKLAAIMKAADAGNPLQYFELAEQIEERDLHYLGILGTRRRQVSQIPVTVEAASDAADHQAHADMVRAWLKRDELQDELFDILDAIGKGISFTEIVWDVSEGQWQPKKLAWRTQRWFTFARTDLETPLLRDIGATSSDGTAGTDLPYGKFITARIKAKSGLAIRSGIARAAAWAWMFKAFTAKDWALFSQSYGQPIRIGKWQGNPTNEEKATLLRAVTNIAADCAAIIPASMTIDFVEAKTAQQSGDNYKNRVDWLDQQMSKAVLGQTTTTDAVSGGHAVSKEHRKVQEDIARADAKALQGVLNQDLMRVWIDLEFGPQKQYPRFVIEEADETDIPVLSQALEKLVPLGLKVSASEVRAKLNLSEPEDGDELLESAVNLPRGPLPDPAPQAPLVPKAQSTPVTKGPKDIVDHIGEATSKVASPALSDLIDRVRQLVDEASSLDDVKHGLLDLYPGMKEDDLAAAMRLALTFAELAGRDDGDDTGADA